jgi:hypothetical protein
MGPKKCDLHVDYLYNLSFNNRCDIVDKFLNSINCIKKSTFLPFNGSAGYGPHTLSVKKISDGDYYYIKNYDLFYIFGNKYASIVIDCNLLVIKFYIFNGMRHWTIRDILNPTNVISDLFEEHPLETEYELSVKFQKFLRLLFSI